MFVVERTMLQSGLKQINNSASIAAVYFIILVRLAALHSRAARRAPLQLTVPSRDPLPSWQPLLLSGASHQRLTRRCQLARPDLCHGFRWSIVSPEPRDPPLSFH